MEDRPIFTSVRTLADDIPVTESARPEFDDHSRARADVLESLFRTIPLPLCIYDDRRRLLFADPAGVALIGRRVEEIGDGCEWPLLPSDVPRWRRFIRESLFIKASRRSYFRLRHRRGDWLWVYAEASAFTTGMTRLVAVRWKNCSDDIREDPRVLSPEL